VLSTTLAVVALVRVANDRRQLRDMGAELGRQQANVAALAEQFKQFRVEPVLPFPTTTVPRPAAGPMTPTPTSTPPTATTTTTGPPTTTTTTSPPPTTTPPTTRPCTTIPVLGCVPGS
jgi:hypothetical protein